MPRADPSSPGYRVLNARRPYKQQIPSWRGEFQPSIMATDVGVVSSNAGTPTTILVVRLTFMGTKVTEEISLLPVLVASSNLTHVYQIGNSSLAY